VSTHTRRRKYELQARAERQRETRERIIAATAALHAERGPARTTIADIARRAVVQRLTVYNTFPDRQALFGACQQHFLAANPPPDITPQPASQPLAALETALRRLYGWFRSNKAMERHVHRDRHLIPELDALMTRTGDARLAAAADAHARAIAGGSRPSAALSAVVNLAFQFAAWEVLSREGLRDAAIATLMTAAVRSQAPRGRARTHAMQPRRRR
jgi:AcrR family transcriptional regulator